MRVLWITSDFWPDMGGIETYTDQVTHQLALRGHQIGLITTGRQSLPARSLVSKHFSIESLDRPKTSLAIDDISSQLAAIMTSFEPELVHFASAGLAVYSNAFPSFLPRVATVHGNDLTKPWQFWPTGNVGEMIRLGLARCATVFSVSRYTASLLAAAGLVEPVRIVLNSCDLQTFYPRPIDREAVLSRYDVDSDAALILTVARIVPRKGHNTVLAALSRIQCAVHWIVVGQGRSLQSLWSSHLAAGQRSRVTFVDRVSQSELVELYNACDIFVLTPFELRQGGTVDSEGFGLVFLEAGACEKPVIGSRISGCVDSIADEETGLLVQEGDIVGLAGAMQRLIEDAALRRRLGSEARRRIIAGGGWGRVAEEISQQYTMLVDSRFNG